MRACEYVHVFDTHVRIYACVCIISCSFFSSCISLAIKPVSPKVYRWKSVPWLGVLPTLRHRTDSVVPVRTCRRGMQAVRGIQEHSFLSTPVKLQQFSCVVRVCVRIWVSVCVFTFRAESSLYVYYLFARMHPRPHLHTSQTGIHTPETYTDTHTHTLTHTLTHTYLRTCTHTPYTHVHLRTCTHATLLSMKWIFISIFFASMNKMTLFDDGDSVCVLDARYIKQQAYIHTCTYHLDFSHIVDPVKAHGSSICYKPSLDSTNAPLGYLRAHFAATGSCQTCGWTHHAPGCWWKQLARVNPITMQRRKEQGINNVLQKGWWECKRPTPMSPTARTTFVRHIGAISFGC